MVLRCVGESLPLAVIMLCYWLPLSPKDRPLGSAVETKKTVPASVMFFSKARKLSPNDCFFLTISSLCSMAGISSSNGWSILHVKLGQSIVAKAQTAGYQSSFPARFAIGSVVVLDYVTYQGVTYVSPHWWLTKGFLRDDSPITIKSL